MILKFLGLLALLFIAAMALNQVAAPPQKSEAEIAKAREDAENKCADPEQCREANRKAYGDLAKREAAAKQPASAKVQPANAWTYQTAKDEMRGTEVMTASLDSPKLLSFPFPYQGGSKVTLNLIKRSGKTEIMLSISKGQFICYRHDGGEVSARFDGGNVQSFQCADAVGGSAKVMFIQPESRFLAALKRSKKLIIEATFYNQGRLQIPFETAGLVWK